MNRFALGLLALIVFAAPAHGIADEAADSAAVPLAEWAGEWVLDHDASDSIDPMLELLGTPWIVRKMAGTMTPTFTFSVLPAGDGLHWVNANPIRTTERDITGDGVRRELEDPLGRKYVSSERWSESGDLVMSQTHRRDDRAVEVVATWSRVDDRLEIVNRTKSDDRPLVIRRVFRRKR